VSRFVADSPLEGDGFEPSVPRQIRSRFESNLMHRTSYIRLARVEEAARASATTCAGSARPTPPQIWRGSTNSLFKSSAPGASPGRERNDAGNLPVGSARDLHIAGSDILSGEPKGGGHQRHKLRIVAPTAFERKQRSDSAARAAPSG
jgi:hypothetical protein